MKYISLNNSSLTVFISKGKLTELSGSSKYNVFNGELVRKEKSQNGKIENRSCLLDYLNNLEHDNLSNKVIERLRINYFTQYIYWYNLNFISESALNYLESMEKIIKRAENLGNEFVIKSEIVNKNISEQNCRYKTTVRKKNSEKKINKTKVKGKMYALFNLNYSRKFMAFYSVSFPLNSNDNDCFECWNYWLTCLRKRFGLLNYVWVTERQKNGTLHFHMLTNNYMPILQINRAMAIIINNKCLTGTMSWGNSSLDKFNGVDVDSIFNSKRHKKTGKILNPSELRNWITKYITKYVTKNTEKFKHLCWHCSRSVSMLFTSTLLEWKERRNITDFLPTDKNKYIQFKSEFNHTCIFKFVPLDALFDKIKAFNNLVNEHYDPSKIKYKNSINFKTTIL